MSKKSFEGEGNPSSAPVVGVVVPVQTAVATVKQFVSDAEREVLKKLLDRDRTSRIVHGGLKQLLQLSDDEVKSLLGFLDRI
jgi:hypothetical protein